MSEDRDSKSIIDFDLAKIGLTAKQLGGPAKKNKEIVAAWLYYGLVSNTDGKSNAGKKFFHSGYKFNRQPRSWKQATAWVAGLHGRIPGFKFKIEEMLAEGDTVAIRWKLSGEHKTLNKTKGYLGGTNIMKLKNGQIHENIQNGIFSNSWSSVTIGHYIKIQNEKLWANH